MICVRLAVDMQLVVAVRFVVAVQFDVVAVHVTLVQIIKKPHDSSFPLSIQSSIK